MELHALTGQLYLVDGVEQDGSIVPGLLSAPSPSRAAHGRQDEVLFVHLTLSGAMAETADLLQEEVQQMAEAYFQSSGSVTAALRQVIQKTNARLLQLNLSAPGPSRVGAITCAVQRGNELFVVQAGESLALIGRNFGVERMPARQPDRLTALGQTAGLDFRYYHQRLQAGDMLLLADPRISHLPSHALAPALVDTELELGIDELRQVAEDATCRLMLVEFTDEPDNLQAAVITSSRITLPPGLRFRSASEPVTIPAQPKRQASAGEPGGQGAAGTADSVEFNARQAAATSVAGLSRATGWTADAMARLRPPAKEKADGTHWAVPTLLAIIIPLLVALVVTSVYMQRGRVRQVTELRESMSANLAAAQETAAEPDIARGHYETILALADEAEALRPGDAGVAELRRQAMLAIDELDGVARLSARPFFSFGDSTQLAAVAIRDDFTGGVFVLDGASGAVYGLDTDEAYETVLSEEPETLSFSGQAIGNHVVQKLVDIMWRPSGVEVERGGLAMLDSGGALVTHYPTEDAVRSTPLGLSSEWQGPTDITQFLERLYILDPPSEVIWKYFPQGEGFEVEQGEQTLFLGADTGLRGASDIDLYGEDGSLLVTYADGRIRYIDTSSGRVQWDEADLLNSGLAEPLQMPVAGRIIGRGLNASIFILDAGSGRVIQTSRLGNVLAQYRATDSRGQDIFSGATDLAVAETPLRLFVTRGNQLYLSTQP